MEQFIQDVIFHLILQRHGEIKSQDPKLCRSLEQNVFVIIWCLTFYSYDSISPYFWYNNISIYLYSLYICLISVHLSSLLKSRLLQLFSLSPYCSVAFLFIACNFFVIWTIQSISKYSTIYSHLILYNKCYSD